MSALSEGCAGADAAAALVEAPGRAGDSVELLADVLAGPYATLVERERLAGLLEGLPRSAAGVAALAHALGKEPSDAAWELARAEHGAGMLSGALAEERYEPHGGGSRNQLWADLRDALTARREGCRMRAEDGTSTPERRALAAARLAELARLEPGLHAVLEPLLISPYGFADADEAAEHDERSPKYAVCACGRLVDKEERWRHHRCSVCRRASELQHTIDEGDENDGR